jgi:hypothetical protein
MVVSLFLLSLLSMVQLSSTFVVPRPLGWISSSSLKNWPQNDVLFAEDEEIVPICENYIHAKYKESAKLHGHKFCSKDDAAEVLVSILPPVTPGELAEEIQKTLEIIMKNPKNSEDKIDEDDFVKAIVQNSYWRAAGDLVVKELMYFDALYHYYRTGSPLLNDSDYETLKENLTWEGSSVATMKAKEALFVSAVAASRRGEPIIDDEEYKALKSDLIKEDSWVVARGQDALEKLGLNTFMGYLHRAL